MSRPCRIRHLETGFYFSDEGTGFYLKEELLGMFKKEYRGPQEGLRSAFYYDDSSCKYGFEITDGQQLVFLVEADTMVDTVQTAREELVHR